MRAKALLAGAALCTSLSMSAGVASAEARSADFYAGKTITLVVGTDVAGGFSIYSRLIADYLGKYIPGAPKIVVENMPGSGGSKAASWLYNRAPRDGLTFANLTPDSIMDPLFGRPTPIEAVKFSYLAGAEKSTRLCVVSSHSKVKTFAQALHQQLIVGATQLGGPTSDYANFIQRGTGAKFHVVLGYGGTGALYLAMQRGEIESACGVDWDALKAQQGEQLRDKEIGVLLQIDVKSDPELDALGVPQPWQYMHDPLDRKAVALMVAFQQTFGKAYVAPPEVPADRLQILRDGLAATLKDKDLLADARKRHLDVDYISAADVTRTVTDIYQASHAAIDRLREMAGANN